MSVSKPTELGTVLETGACQPSICFIFYFLLRLLGCYRVQYRGFDSWPYTSVVQTNAGADLGDVETPGGVDLEWTDYERRPAAEKGATEGNAVGNCCGSNVESRPVDLAFCNIQPLKIDSLFLWSLPSWFTNLCFGIVGVC